MQAYEYADETQNEIYMNILKDIHSHVK